MARYLVQVIDAMLAVVPKDEALAISIKAIRAPAHYCAPEAEALYWQKAAAAIEFHLGPDPQPGWQTKVAEVFAGRGT